MGFPIKQRITTLMQTSNGGCESASGLDILSAAIESRLLQHSELSYPSSSVTKSAEGEIKAVEGGCDEDSTASSAPSPSASVTASATSQKRHRVVVSSSLSGPVKHNKRSRTFPEILMGILSNPDYAHIIRWSTSGRSFAIHDPSLFSSQILPKYFRRVIFRSFVRKLNRWGFHSMRRWSEAGGLESSNDNVPRFEHKLFTRDEPEMCVRIFCKSNPGAGKVDKPANEVDGQGSGDDSSCAGNNACVPGDDATTATVMISPSASSFCSFSSAVSSAAAARVVPHSLPMQQQFTGGVGVGIDVRGLVPHLHNEDFRVLSKECILLEIQRRRDQAFMNRVRMAQMTADADILSLSQIVAEKWQQQMLLQRGWVGDK
jgi:hypothetical protein